jgi:hypothetical protein
MDQFDVASAPTVIAAREQHALGAAAGEWTTFRARQPQEIREI